VSTATYPHEATIGLFITRDRSLLSISIVVESLDVFDGDAGEKGILNTFSEELRPDDAVALEEVAQKGVAVQLMIFCAQLSPGRIFTSCPDHATDGYPQSLDASCFQQVTFIFDSVIKHVLRVSVNIETCCSLLESVGHHVRTQPAAPESQQCDPIFDEAMCSAYSRPIKYETILL
jgi:hypothetical protein